jgi:hypothetical protein
MFVWLSAIARGLGLNVLAAGAFVPSRSGGRGAHQIGRWRLRDRRSLVVRALAAEIVAAGLLVWALAGADWHASGLAGGGLAQRIEFRPAAGIE